MGLGYLTVTARMGDDAIPVAGALVTVRDKRGEILYQVHTDENGNTGTFSLPAPDKEFTLSPEYARSSYASYDVEIAKAGYNTINVHDAQVYDTIESIQPFRMMPDPPGADPETEHIFIPPPAVLNPLGQSGQVGAIGAGPRRALNPDVVIPDFITVRLGRPNDTSARNVRVRFIDYIKNVTSSEIFPTWPVNSLISNIHAIVSFTLNRVYSEWYPSRGFNFNITNTTQYDQMFIYGRDIFRNISDLVDRYFNTYARRFGFRNPFFTSYCNGTTARCNGLSQWGTVTLANQGRNPLQILHNFYPRDLELVVSNNIGGIPDSFPGADLRAGSTGDAVARVQFLLNRIRLNFPLIPVITQVNGVYGADTEAAVRAFQRSFNMTQDGVVGRATWNRITQIYTAVTGISALEGEGERITIGQNPPAVVLRQNASGAHVRELQFILNVVSTFNSAVPSVVIDGRFGPNTTNAVREFQRNYGLTTDGVVGPATWARLYAVYRELAVALPPPPPPVVPPPAPPPSGGGGGTAAPFPGTLLRVGSRSEDVRRVQTMINTVADRGVTGIPRLTTDGVFGPLTEASVRAFQSRFGLSADGIVGPITWGELVRQSSGGGAAPPAPPVTPPPAPPPSGGGGGAAAPFPGTLLRVGSRSEDVRRIQSMINAVADRGVTGIPRLSTDGVFGPLTEASVRAFQSRFGLSADGIVGPITWAELVRQSGGGTAAGGSTTPQGFVCVPYPGVPLRLGVSGQSVIALQRFLNELAPRVDPSAPRLVLDGSFGPMTQNAVIAFQRRFGLAADGVAGPMTWNRILLERSRM